MTTEAYDKVRWSWKRFSSKRAHMTTEAYDKVRRSWKRFGSKFATMSLVSLAGAVAWAVRFFVRWV